MNVAVGTKQNHIWTPHNLFHSCYNFTQLHTTILSALFSQGRNSLSIPMFTKACVWTLS